MLGLGVAEGVGTTLGVGTALGVGVAEGVGVALGAGLIVGVGVTVGVIVGVMVGEGVCAAAEIAKARDSAALAKKKIRRVFRTREDQWTLRSRKVRTPEKWRVTCARRLCPPRGGPSRPRYHVVGWHYSHSIVLGGLVEIS